MKRFLTFLALCCLMVTGVWADGFIASTVASPKAYILTNANSMTIASNLTYHDTEGSGNAAKGMFAFISTNEANKYKIYETEQKKFVGLKSGYSKACNNGTELVEESQAEVFTIEASNTTGQYLISPTTITDKTYLNFYQGGNANKSGETIGFYTTGNGDAGSLWTFEEALPVKTVASASDLSSNSTWYQLMVRYKYVKYDANSQTYYDTYDARPEETDETSLFAFVGNQTDGYKIVNKAAGNSKAMGADNANTGTRLKSVDLANARTFLFKKVSSSNAGTWQIYDKNDNAAYLNQQGTNLGYWKGGGGGDDGNRFTFTEVVFGAEKVDVTYVFTNAYNETVNVVVKTSVGATATAPSVSYFSNATITEENKVVGTDNTTFHVNGTWNFPFQEGKDYTMHSKANENNYVFDGTNAWYNNSVAVADHNNLWQFQHVAGTLDLYMLKTYSGKYAVLESSGRKALTFADEPTKWTSGTGATSYFRVVAQNGGFDLQHPGDVKTNVGSHVDGKLGSWQADGSPTNDNSINVVTEAPVEVAYTLSPENNATVESLEEVSVQFSAVNSYYPYMASEFAKPEVLPYFTQGETNVTATLAKNNESDGLYVITPSETLTDGVWTLTIPEGAFWSWQGSLDASAQPVAEITATYTVAPTLDEIATFDYGWLPGTTDADAQWKAWTGEAPEVTSGHCATTDLYVIEKRYEFTNETNILQVTFQHDGGNQRTDIVGVEVTAANGTVYSDYHHGYTGGAKADNVYTINNIPAGTYTVRYITTKHWEEEGKPEENNTKIKGHITPVVTEPIPQITDLANLSNDKAYVLICDRGQLTTSNGQLAGVAEGETAYTAEANKFAIIKNGDKYYLWSVAAEGYVHTTNLNNGKAAYANTGYAAQEITLTAQEDGTTFLLKLAGNSVNMQNNANGVLVDGWVQADQGNKYRIYEVEDFADAEKAIAAIPGNVRVGKVYTIKAHFTGEGYTNHYLSSDASAEQLALVDEASANQSYWVAEASGNNDRPWKFKSGFGYAKYLDWQNNGLSENGDNFKLNTYVNDGTPKSFDYNLNVNTDNRNIGTWAEASKGFGAIGEGGCWSGNAGHNNSDWTTDYIIEEVTGVDVYTVTGTGTLAVKGIEGYTYASSIAAGGVVIVPTGTTLTDENFTVDNETKVLINSADKTIVLLPDYSSNTYYMNIENKDTGRWPFLYNDIEYTKDFTLQAQSVNASSNGFTWKVTFDENGNVTGLVNAETGKGIKHQKDNNSNLTAFNCEYASGDFYYLTFAESGDNRLNAANGNSDGSRRAVTAWHGTENANQWRFNLVDSEDLVEYKVEVSQPEGCRGYVLYDGKKAGNGGFFLAPAGTEQSAFTAGELRGYLCDGVTLNDHTITLTYTAATPVTVNYSLYLKEGETETLLETATEAVTEYVGQAPQIPFTIPDYVDVTYDQGVDENGLIDGEASAIKVITTYNDLMPFAPGELTTVDINVIDHYYFHIEQREITFVENEVEKVETVWVPCISPKAPTFGDDAAYIWRMEGDWYNGFRFHNDQLAKEGEGDGTACHITFRHTEVETGNQVQMEGTYGTTSLTEKEYKLVSVDDPTSNWQKARATLTGDAGDQYSYFDLVHAAPGHQTQEDNPEWQFRLHGTGEGYDYKKHTGIYLNFRNYPATEDNPDSLLCLYDAQAFSDRHSSFTFHKNEVCTEDDRQAVLAMLDAIDKGAVGAIKDQTCQEYLDLIELKKRIEDTTIGCTRALFDIYTEKLVNYAGEKHQPVAGEAYRIAVRTKKGHNLFLKDDGGYTNDSTLAAVYVLAQKGEGQYFLAGNNNAELHYFQNQGGTEAAYDADDCDFSYTAMNTVPVDGENINATGAAMYATVSLNYGGKVPTMYVANEEEAAWTLAPEVTYMNDEYSSAIVLQPTAYPFNKPNFTEGTGDGHDGVFASIWLPFPMQFPDGVQVYKGTQERDVKGTPYLGLTEVDTNHAVAQGGYILYANTTSGIEAGKQLVVPAAAALEDSRVEDDAAFVGSTEGPATGDAAAWTAFLEKYPATEWTPYVLSNKSKGMGFYKYVPAEGKKFMPKGKAIWLKPATDNDSEVVKLGFGDIISAIEALHGNTTNTEIFDLQGRRLDKVQKGQINVINGQKIMFK